MMDNFDEMSGRSIYAKNVKDLVLRDVVICGASDGEPELVGVESKVMDGVEYGE
jgi:hypothetical protein